MARALIDGRGMPHHARAVARALHGAAVMALVACTARPAPAPVQPIVFSHRVHAGANAIGCISCHAFAEHAPVAGIPSMERCRGCHKFVRQDPQDRSMTEQIRALLQYLDDDRPIAWVRVHRLPDHVYFTHERHVRGGISCRECHGDVERMEAARQVSPLTMGWCLECHHRKQAERPLERRHLSECVTCHK
jgi:hypothetical protein